MGRINVASSIFAGPYGPQHPGSPAHVFAAGEAFGGVHCRARGARVVQRSRRNRCVTGILAEGAIALSVTLSGGALFAS